MPEETLFCLRVRYAETGRLRYLSQLELLRALERTVRRARLPYAVTQGFSPRMKAAYCPALPVGVGSRDEWLDLWLRSYRPAAERLAALKGAAPPDLAPLEAAYVDPRGPSLSAGLTLATWDFELSAWPGGPLARPEAAPYVGPERVEAAWRAVVAAGSVEYLRDGKRRTVALEGKVAREPEFAALPGGAGTAFSVTTRSSNEGALRPDVLAGALAAQLAESFARDGGPGPDRDGAVVSFRHGLRTSIVRSAQYLEGEDGSWVRPM